MSDTNGSRQEPGLDRSYIVLRDAATRQLQDGLLEEARQGFAAALEVARKAASAPLVDRAFCNLAGVEIELGRAPETIAVQLREMLVDNRDAESCRLAAYHLGRYYDLRKQIKKALFYARIAQERSRQLDKSAWLASSSNQTALLLLSESRFDEASGELERALDLLPAGDELARALVMDNLGYCRFLQGRDREGFALCFRSLRTLRRLGTQQGAAELTVSFGYLKIDRGERALRHGRAALAGAERDGDWHTVKNALFVLGEAAQSVGDLDAAHEYFGRLQQDFYPDQHFLPNFLLAVDVTGLVNLKA